MEFLLRVVKMCDSLVKVQIVNEEACSACLFVALPCNIGKLFECFLEDGFCIFNQETLIASSLDRSTVIHLPNVQPLINLNIDIFDLSTVSN